MLLYTSYRCPSIRRHLSWHRGNVVIDKNFYKNIRCKLASLVCVEDCRTPIFFDCFPQKICILQRIHRVEYAPAQDLPWEPVYDCHQVNISCRQLYVSDIRWPYLIRISDYLVSKKIRILLVIFTGFWKILAWKYRRYPESSHYTAYCCFCGVSAVFVYFPPDSAVTIIRMLNLDFLDFYKQIEIFFILLWTRLVIILTSGNPKQFALMRNA